MSPEAILQNVEVVRRAHEAFNPPDLGVFDLDAFYRLADRDRVVVEPLFTLRDGLISRVAEVSTRAEALKTVGLEE